MKHSYVASRWKFISYVCILLNNVIKENCKQVRNEKINPNRRGQYFKRETLHSKTVSCTLDKHKFCGKQLRTISTVTIFYKTCKLFFKLAYELQTQLLKKKKNFQIEKCKKCLIEQLSCWLTAASRAVFSRRAPTQPVNPMMNVIAPDQEK